MSQVAKCPNCSLRKSGQYPNGWCRKCYDEHRNRLPIDLTETIKEAQQTGDWKKLADSLGPVIRDIADGSVKATAAQSSLIHHIMDRAYGKVSKTQEDKAGAIGIVLLPVQGDGKDLKLCPLCRDFHTKHG